MLWVCRKKQTNETILIWDTIRHIVGKSFSVLERHQSFHFSLNLDLIYETLRCCTTKKKYIEKKRNLRKNMLISPSLFAQSFRRTGNMCLFVFFNTNFICLY